MRCTNRKNVAINLLIIMSILLVGCTEQAYDMPYTKNTKVSTFQITEEKNELYASSFARELCVTANDVKENTDLNLDEVGAAGLFDLKNNKVIYASNIHEKLYPASLTKVMTALVALKYSNLDDKITVPKKITFNESGVTTCGIEQGDVITLDQALHALLVSSANDAAIVIANHIGGSVEGFSDLMNEEAKRIGATNSHFVNPHGLSDNNHYTTAYDMYLIFNEAMKQEHFNEIIFLNEYSTVYQDKNGKAKELKISTTNQYLKGTYEQPKQITVMGGKTGTTNAAGNCLVLYTKDSSGNPYISVILRSKERELLYQQMSELLDEIYNL